ncbi:extracellular solute-binding protein [Paenibacillus filicis]|uniref:Extracellular solute-binding protein n=1 Tax=Paenibacillus gyeongsangnamensis TaxID=3388067 RepID=A0ABT4Q9I1_9BACL|nr:extracellular solute-binding protein [Paenibacillus filicis]MCZ8513533.1 extracellular solute-binding protein [Paenibacillus filicis]
MRHSLSIVLAFSLCGGLLAGCSGAKGGDPGQTKASETFELPSDPVTVQFAASTTMFPEEDFQRYVADPVKKKYPNITVERINTSEKGKSMNDLVVAGTVPDIVVLYPGNLNQLNDLGLAFNHEELMKKHKFDSARVIPEMLETIKIASNQNHLLGLPSYNNAFALFYNKDVFDRFGVPYPKDGMTWDDVKQLALKLTRMDGGIQYRGIYADNLYRGGRQLALPYADFKTGKAQMQTDAWKELMTLWAGLYDIPGVMAGDFKSLNYGKNEQALVKGELAMLVGYSNTLGMLRKAPDVKWDLVAYPENKKAPGVGQRVDTPVLSITNQSKNKDAAFKVLETVLSDEVQSDMARNGRAPVLKDEKVRAQYGQGIPEFQGKNLAAMIKPKLAVIAPLGNINEGDFDRISNAAFQSVANKEKDINTALRESDEQVNKVLEAAKNGTK